MKECDILGGQNIFRPVLHIFRGLLQLQDLRPSSWLNCRTKSLFVRLTKCNASLHLLLFTYLTFGFELQMNLSKAAAFMIYRTSCTPGCRGRQSYPIRRRASFVLVTAARRVVRPQFAWWRRQSLHPVTSLLL